MQHKYYFWILLRTLIFVNGNCKSIFINVYSYFVSLLLLSRNIVGFDYLLDAYRTVNVENSCEIFFMHVRFALFNAMSVKYHLLKRCHHEINAEPTHKEIGICFESPQ